MYVITNEGLQAFEKTGLKKILDESFPKLRQDLSRGYMYDDEIKDYAEEHGIPDLMEKIGADGIFDKDESFIIHSEIVCDSLKDKLPKKLDKELKNAISAYWIYYTRFIDTYSHNYVWRDKNSLNKIESDVHGDMQIWQYDLSTEKDLFGDKPFVKKSESNLVNGFYPDWVKTLIDFITFCSQIKQPVPFRESWEKEFYNGKFQEEKPGEVAKWNIMELKLAKENEENSHINVLPFIENPMKHIKPDGNIYGSEPVKSDGGYLSQPFIEGNSLVYLHEKDNGIKFMLREWGKPGVKFNYEQIGNAIKGIVTCIQKSGSRSMPHDPGLVFKYFPYERFENLEEKI